MNKRNSTSSSSARAAGLAVTVVLLIFGAVTPLLAQNTNYTPGDLVLFFQSTGTIGNNQQVFASLGNTATVFRNATPGSSVTITNISSAMDTAYGSGWAGSTTLYGGAGGVWSSSTGSSLQNGDPSRTTYTTLARSSIGTVGEADSGGFAIGTTGAMTAMATAISGQNNILETQASTRVAVISFNPADALTPSIKNINPPGGNGWNNNIVTPGVQQQGTGSSMGTFGSYSNVVFLWDLYRIQARNDVSGQYGQGEPIREGLYLGTIVLTASGDVGFVAASDPSVSPYDTWVTSYSLDPTTDGAKSADPDGDGFDNFQEFAFGTNPTVGNAALTSAARSVNDIVVSSFQRDGGATNGISSYTLQTRADLSTSEWVASDVTGVSGTPDGDYTPVTYTVPLTSPRAFYRLIATE